MSLWQQFTLNLSYQTSAELYRAGYSWSSKSSCSLCTSINQLICVKFGTTALFLGSSEPLV